MRHTRTTARERGMLDKARFLERITADAESHIELLQRFIQARSPNPPGNTAAAAQVLREYLSARGVATEIIAPDGLEKPNFVAERGGVDMKAGTAASVIAFAYLHQHRQHLRRKHSSVALTVVSDEETGGKFGSRYPLERDPAREAWKGTVMINAEPGGLQSIRFGEKGTLRMTFRVVTLGVHGAYTHLSEGANRIAARLIGRLVDVVEAIQPEWDDEVHKQLKREEVTKVIDEIMGEGAHTSVLRPTVNIGTIHGGIKVNMIPDRCVFEADIRLPIGLLKNAVLARIDELLRDEFPTTAAYEVQEAASNPPSHCSPSHEMVGALANAAETVTGRRPLAIPSLGATDAKFWRYHQVPAYVYGVGPETMAAAVDERVSVKEFLSVVRTHALAVWSFLDGE
ncbi:uncharacterized protein A1O9_03433 [Exophiala aquamarina CBS 119918]|uniref:Peptidase M20 dimerisation domain-containing protein n=1 Tax=Exophiala aquamarina CBS 119918 TaxID=1182545 RepID=A0A072PQ63_9EURO|nr:uncharacterized protein A1O9_03433 [Exophiala aquamarina CBS 119918]KEF61862.1 hypothetical protein A1O9_03433 [Exophiala aquamarina CBS 119918]